MSLIAGVFYHDLRPVPEADESHLRQVRAHAGSDAIQTVSAPGLLMGQAASSFDSSRFDSTSQRTPGVSADGSACLWDGRLDNRESLLLRFSREVSRSSFFGAIAALKLYEAEGTGGLRHLIGDWSLALWDARSKSVVLASDYAGIRPLYYYRGPDRLYWSSSLADLVRWTGVDALDEEYAARFLLSRIVPRRTPYSGIQSVPPGRAVRISPEGSSEEPFWRLPVHQELRLEDDRDYEEGLRTLFREAVQVRLSGDSAVCAELSGGLDSSSVVCMSERLLASSRKPITFSYTHEGCRDVPYIRAVEQACNIEGIHFDLRDCPLVTATQAGGAAPAWWEPRLMALARRMETLGAGVLLTGQLGDFVMGNVGDDSEQVADCLQQRRFAAAVREAFAWSQYLQLPFYTIFSRAIRTTWFSWTAPPISDAFSGPDGAFARQDSLTPKMRALLSAARRGPDRRADWQEAMPSRRRRFQMLSDTVEGRVLQVPEPLQHFSYSHPFAHRPLVEFMLTIPPGQVCRPGEMRRLMRRAFATLLPAPVVSRKSKAVYTQPYRQALLSLASVLAAEPRKIRTVELGFLERDSLLERLRRFSQGLDCHENQLRQVLLFEFWLRNREKPAVSGGDAQCLQGTTTSTLVPCPSELQTENVAPI